MRRLEIGPGSHALPGFEGLDIVRRKGVQHVGNATAPPFPEGTFDEVYSSHCIEHVDWWLVEPTIGRWVRILKPGGSLEVHTLDATRWMRALIEFEETGEITARSGTWRADLHGHDPYVHAVGRLMCYSKKGDGGANMHRTLITPRYLRRCFERAGLAEIEVVDQPRGDLKHRMVNIGLRGRKP